MDISNFTENATGKLVDTPYNVKVFVPNPLPPQLDYSKLTIPLMNAAQAVGELKGACHPNRIQNPYILVSPLQRREALTSSAMEGTFTTADELILVDAGLELNPDQSSLEVRNYLRALSETLRMLQEDGLPICHKMIKTAHRILLSGVGSYRGSHRLPGEYKSDQNAIGGRRKGIENARFIPPPPIQASNAMDDLEAYINRPNQSNIPPLIDLALVHYQLETIHPFSDGNGRVGRMLISLMAVERQIFESPLLYLSPELEERKDEYIDLMLKVSMEGAWTEWVIFFLEIVEASAKASIEVVDRLITLQKTYREIITASSRSTNPVLLVDRLFNSPVVTVRDVQDEFNITYRPARNTIDKLVENGILIEVPTLYPAVFIAPKILRIADRNE